MKSEAFRKTEILLKNYKLLKVAADLSDQTPRTRAMIALIDGALQAIAAEPYFHIIEKYFFRNETREAIAEEMNVEPITITRNKNRLVEKLSIIIFPEQRIKDMVE